MRIAFVPIDNRPVCYTLPRLIAEIDECVDFLMPSRDLLGDLTKSADVVGLFDWLMNIPKVDAIVLALDTVAYGGLIPSRRCSDNFETIKARMQALKEILEEKECKIYAFSSIMRISNNNYNEEEKEYWSEWGKKIFEYSYNSHKSGMAMQEDIPSEILNDYINTRRRNFEINKLYLNWQKEGLFDTLIFSKDDCAEYGFNVYESQILEKMGGFIKTGADEIPMSLLSRAIQGELKICPIFIEPESKDLISNYEDISIERSVKSQIELAGCKCCNQDEADILLYVNNFKEHQGEIVMGVDTEGFSGEFEVPDRPYMIADVRFANGSDNGFIEALLKNNIKDKDFFGYAGWNTSANSLGSLICGAKFKYFAGKYNKAAFDKLQITRFLDDWGYQANIRQNLSKTDIDILSEKMKNYEKVVGEKFGIDVVVKYIYPWDRLFEVEIELS